MCLFCVEMNGFLCLLAAGIYLCSQCQVTAGEYDLNHLQIARDALINHMMKINLSSSYAIYKIYNFCLFKWMFWTHG